MIVASPTIKRNGKQVSNKRHAPMPPVIVHRLKYYGDPDRLRWALAFQEKKRRLKVPVPDLHAITLKEMAVKFGISEHTAIRDLGGLRAYRQARFAQELETNTSRLYEDLHRIAQKAEADKEYAAAVAAHRELAKLTGAYAPMKVDVEHTVQSGPTLKDQLRLMMGVLSPEAQAGLELALTELETAKRDGRLQLPSGDEDDSDAAVDDAEFEDDKENEDV